jgi:hypothetical protein
MDPWRNFEPETVDVPTRTFLRKLYLMTSTYLKAGGLNYRVDGLFLWGCASWDQLGVHVGSYSDEGSYRERGVITVVMAHNAAVNGQLQVSNSAKVLPNGTWVDAAPVQVVATAKARPGAKARPPPPKPATRAAAKPSSSPKPASRAS